MKQFRDTPYYVTEDGKVFRYYPKREYINNKGYVTQKYPEKYRPLKPIIQKNQGREYVVLWNKEKPKRFIIHRLVAELYVPGYFEGAEVDHIDCNKLNNHYTNLQWCTPEYNRKKGNNVNYPLFAQI